jgi:hypothetical protein
MNMNTPNQPIKPFIMFQRSIPEWTFKDSKLFSLLAYCARKARRVKKEIVLSDDGTVVELDAGEFLIGRFSVERDTDLTIAEYRVRWKKMQALGWVEQIETTSKYTKGKLVSSDIFDINTEENSQPMTSKQPAVSQPMTTNNNDKNVKNDNNAAASQVSESGNSLIDRASIDAAFSAYLEVRATQAKPANPQGFKYNLLKVDRPVFKEVFDLIEKMKITSAEASSDDMQVADKASRLLQAYSRKLDDYPAAMSSHIRKWLKNKDK